MADDLVDAMAKLERGRVLKNVRREIENGTDSLEIIEKLSQGLKIVGLKIISSKANFRALSRRAICFSDS